MTLNQFLTAAAVMLVLAILLLGSGIVLARGQRKKEAARIAQEKQEMLKPAAPEGPLEILRVLRDPADGRLALQLLGRTAGAPSDLNPGQRDQLRRVIGELSGWLGTTDTAPEAAEPAAPGADRPSADAEAGLGAAPTLSTDPEGAPGDAQPLSTIVPFASTLPERVELKDVLPFRRKNLPKLSEAPQTPRTIVEQIDDILQERILNSPLAGQTIRLSETPGGGLTIVAGEKQFQAIDDVDDPAVKALIVSAVREWNEKNRLKPS